MTLGAASRPGPVTEAAEQDTSSALHRPPGPIGVAPLSTLPYDGPDSGAFLLYCQQRITGGAQRQPRQVVHPLAFLVGREGRLVTRAVPDAERPRVCVLLNRLSGPVGWAMLLADASLHEMPLHGDDSPGAAVLRAGMAIEGVPVEARSARHWLAQGWIKASRLQAAAACVGWPAAFA